MIKVQFSGPSKILFIYKRTTVFIDLFLIPVVLLVVLSHMLQPFVITVISIYLHEMTHIMMAIFKKCKVSGMGILPVGFNACIDDNELNEIHKLCIYLSGCCMNIVIAALFASLFSTMPISSEIVKTNIALAIFNLIPIQPLDGGKCLLVLLEYRNGLYSAQRVSIIVTKVIAALLILLGIILSIKKLFFLCIVLLGFFILFNLKNTIKEIASMNIRNILYRRSRFLKRGVYSTRQIVVTKQLSLSEAVRAMDYADVFHIVHVLDDELKLLRTFTEQEIIDKLINGTGDLTFEDLIKCEKVNEKNV